MTPATSTLTTAPPPRAPGPPGLRLQLDPTMAGTGAVDGGWWPRSRDPDAELPGLIAALDSSLGPVTRVALNLPISRADIEPGSPEEQALMATTSLSIPSSAPARPAW